MALSRTVRLIARGSGRVAIVAACLLTASCSGIEPMDFPDERENPTLRGVFTGKPGEWVIYRKEGGSSGASPPAGEEH